MHGNHGACLPKDDTVRFKTRFYLDLKFRLPIMVSQSRGKFATDFKGDKLSLLIMCVRVFCDLLLMFAMHLTEPHRRKG